MSGATCFGLHGFGSRIKVTVGREDGEGEKLACSRKKKTPLSAHLFIRTRGRLCDWIEKIIIGKLGCSFLQVYCLYMTAFQESSSCHAKPPPTPPPKRGILIRRTKTLPARNPFFMIPQKKRKRKKMGIPQFQSDENLPQPEKMSCS